MVARNGFETMLRKRREVPADACRKELRDVVRYYESTGADYGSRAFDGWFHWIRLREHAALIRLLDPPAGAEVLDAGCGSGLLAQRFLTRGARIWGVDLAPALLRTASPWLEQAFVADVEYLDLGRTFDAVLCAGVLDFVASPARALRALARHARRGAPVVILAPGGIGAWIYRIVQRTRGLRARTYTRRELIGYAAGAGLRFEVLVRPSLHCMAMKLVKD